MRLRMLHQGCITLEIVINENLEVRDVIRLNDAVAVFNKDLLLVSAELRKLEQVTLLDARVVQDRLIQNDIFDVFKRDLVITQLLEYVTVPIKRRIH